MKDEQMMNYVLSALGFRLEVLRRLIEQAENDGWRRQYEEERAALMFFIENHGDWKR